MNAPSIDPRRIAIIGFGEVGPTFARGFIASGRHEVAAYDILLDDRTAAAAMREKAQAAGVEIATSAAAAAAGARIVISAVTAASSRSVAVANPGITRSPSRMISCRPPAVTSGANPASSTVAPIATR